MRGREPRCSRIIAAAHPLGERATPERCAHIEPTICDVVVVAPAGRIDHATAGELERVLMPLLPQSGSGRQGLILDFAGVDYISSVGLRVLMIAAKQTRTHGARIAVAALQPVVAEIFTISRFDSVLECRRSGTP